MENEVEKGPTVEAQVGEERNDVCERLLEQEVDSCQLRVDGEQTTNCLSPSGPILRFTHIPFSHSPRGGERTENRTLKCYKCLGNSELEPGSLIRN